MTTLEGPPSAKTTVLVVDDEEIMRDLLERMLQRAGYRVICAADGEEGLAQFRAQDVDVVITDIAMPGMDGLGLIQALAHECPRVSVIAVSGANSRGRHLKRATELGAKAALLKPVASTDLIDNIELAISTRH
jgi:CheY-like chemotaxis protein